jgi:leader peptidase (prepilin peptidase)/N-methyltransferase
MLTSSPAHVVFWVAAALGGAVLGSFQAAWAVRHVQGQSVVKGRSRCPSCGRTLGWAELVPLVSWLAQRGRCRGCNDPVSILYPAMESSMALLCLGLALRWGPGWAFGLYLAVCGLLLTAAFVDLLAWILPEVMVLPAGVVGLAGSTLLLGLPWPGQVMGVVAGAGAFWLVRAGYRLLRGREGLGAGDVKLMGAIGGLTGWQGLVPVALAGSLVALGGIAILAASGRPRPWDHPLPYGPFLVLGLVLHLLLGPVYWPQFTARVP